MPAPIVVDVGVADPPRELAAALVDACTQAATSIGTECRLVKDAPSGSYAAVAIVTWEEGDRARVEVGIRREPVSDWRVRELTFQAADAVIERYRSVGFVIGSLTTLARDEEAKATSRASEPPPPKPAASAPPKKSAPPPKTEPKPESGRAAEPEPGPEPAQRGSSARRGFIGVTGTLGGGLDRGAARYGAQLSLGVHVVPHLGALVTGGLSTRGRDAAGLTPDWLDAGVGLLVTLGPPRGFHFEARTQVIAEHFTAHAQVGTESKEFSRTVVGERTGLDAVLPLGGMFELVAGGEVMFRPATRVHVQSLSDGATRNAELGAVAGVRLAL